MKRTIAALAIAAAFVAPAKAGIIWTYTDTTAPNHPGIYAISSASDTNWVRLTQPIMLVDRTSAQYASYPAEMRRCTVEFQAGNDDLLGAGFVLVILMNGQAAWTSNQNYYPRTPTNLSPPMTTIRAQGPLYKYTFIWETCPGMTFEVFTLTPYPGIGYQDRIINWRMPFAIHYFEGTISNPTP